MLQSWFERQWQTRGWAQCLLRPLSWLFILLAAIRRQGYRSGFFSSHALPVPVIVVGNISVGGVGKTPVVISLAEQLRAAGYQPGILSRGYGGRHQGEVTPHSDATQVGDEPALIARRTGCPVWVNVDRSQAGRALLQAHPAVDVLICDDGLQHYALKRDIEIAVVQRPLGLGNGLHLPAGPLREPMQRLQTVDVVIETGALPATPAVSASYQLTLQPGTWTAVAEGHRETTLASLRTQPLVAVAGIGHPQRFFKVLSGLGLTCETHSFPDHHAYSRADFASMTQKTILMTEKDAVKCQHLGLEQAWFLPVTAALTPLGAAPPLLEKIAGLLKQSHEAKSYDKRK